MKWVTYGELDDGECWSSDQYQIDWNTNEHRKFRDAMSYVRVYECGVICVSFNGANDPDWRDSVLRTMDLRFLATDSFAGQRFYHPISGNRIPAAHIEPRWLLHVPELERVYSMGNRSDRYPIHFYDPHALPSPSCGVVVQTPNRATHKARIAELQEHISLGQTLVGLQGDYKDKEEKESGNNDWSIRHNRRQSALKIINGDKDLPADLTQLEAQRVCRALVENKSEVERLLLKISRDYSEPNYLYVR
tara:strand:+ start:983 stop:1726 length:744 start_codon:yes stop_codon:yes gene_type:complete